MKLSQKEIRRRIDEIAKGEGDGDRERRYILDAIAELFPADGNSEASRTHAKDSQA